MDQTAGLVSLARSIGCGVLENEPMKNHTTFQIGGPARVMVQPKSAVQLRDIILYLRDGKMPYYVIGRGSDLLVNDEGIDGCVVKIGPDFSGISVDGTTVTACAGASLAQVCLTAGESGLSGLEHAYGIPGYLGGAVFMNAGAYDFEMKQVVKSVSYMNAEGTIKVYSGGELDFSYRHSIFCETDDIILSAELELKPGDPKEIRQEMDAIMVRRKERQPLEYPSGGSTFKRPAGSYASLLIEQCGLKGKRIGGAMVSEKHSGFVINYDHATCRDVLDLIEAVQQEVYEKTGYRLECEIRMI